MQNVPTATRPQAARSKELDSMSLLMPAAGRYKEAYFNKSSRQKPARNIKDTEQPGVNSKNPTTAEEEEVARWLESLCAGLCKASSAGTCFDHPCYHLMAEDCVFDTNYGEQGAGGGNARFKTKKEQFEELKFVNILFPEWKNEIHDCTAIVDLKAGTAEVFLYITVTGCPPGTTGQSFGLAEWKVRDGKWTQVKYTAYKASTGFFGMEPAGEGENTFQGAGDQQPSIGSNPMFG